MHDDLPGEIAVSPATGAGDVVVGPLVSTVTEDVGAGTVGRAPSTGALVIAGTIVASTATGAGDTVVPPMTSSKTDGPIDPSLSRGEATGPKAVGNVGVLATAATGEIFVASFVVPPTTGANGASGALDGVLSSPVAKQAKISVNNSGSGRQPCEVLPESGPMLQYFK